MKTWITVCDTCKREDADIEALSQTPGERLADLVEALLRDDASVEVRRHSCLMGCKQGCNVTIQGVDKLCYTLGSFYPDDSAAEAIMGFAKLHALSETGQVPYRQWPEGVKGHFVTRHPPLPKE